MPGYLLKVAFLIPSSQREYHLFMESKVGVLIRAISPNFFVFFIIRNENVSDFILTFTYKRNPEMVHVFQNAGPMTMAGGQRFGINWSNLLFVFHTHISGSEGIPFKFLNSLDITSDGVIYFTDSSDRWTRKDFRYAVSFSFQCD